MCRTLAEALDALDRDRDFLTADEVFTDDLIDAYVALKRPRSRRSSGCPTRSSSSSTTRSERRAGLKSRRHRRSSMFYYASKLLWASPSRAIFCSRSSRPVSSICARAPQAGCGCSGGVTLALLAIGLLPVGQWLLVPLENRFPPPGDLPARIDGVVMLGGAVEPRVTAARGTVALPRTVERATTLIALARRYPDARLVVTGGGLPVSEAAMLQRFFRDQQLPPERILFEDHARNTHQNAVFSRALAQPRPGERWLLVTSAAHMPRAIGCFEQVGWPVIAYPVDYRTTGRLEPWWDLDVAMRLHELDQAAKAWVGLLAYWLTGRTGALFPAP